jgi:hypothetical protein
VCVAPCGVHVGVQSLTSHGPMAQFLQHSSSREIYKLHTPMMADVLFGTCNRLLALSQHKSG